MDIFLYRQLHLSALVLGLVLGAANLGIGGAFFARRLAERLGMRRTLTLAIAIAGAANLLLPFFAMAWPVVTIFTMHLLLTLCGPIFEVTVQTIRLTLVPPDLLGRMIATNRTLVWGMLPIGALLGGYLGTTVGIVPTMIVGGSIALGAATWMFGCPAVVLDSASPAGVEVLPAT
jgi:MFS family permease